MNSIVSANDSSRFSNSAVSSDSADLRRGASFVAVGLLGLLAVTGCGAGGDEAKPDVSTTDAPVVGAPELGGNSATNAQLAGGDCTGDSCAFEGGDQGTVIAPPGCGDGILSDDEICDDGNRESGDGCAEQCLLTEPGFSCASPGEPCRRIARCGDGLVAPTEQCDDSNTLVGDGCSDRCRVELGKKCSGQPSVCEDAICGNGVLEGAESCDDGNSAPFDGCSPNCLKEPNCDGLSCVSECGDGLLINEQCDDGNLVDGDGCSSNCTTETGFICDNQAVCEEINGTCAIRVPVVFRDFAEGHPDFGGHQCADLAPGALATRLNGAGRPELSGAAGPQGDACMSNAANFAEWYTNNGNNVEVVSELVLFDNGAGGYVNRYGEQGQQFQAVDSDTETNTGAGTLAGCQDTCLARARDGQDPFQGLPPLRCNDLCRPLVDSIQQTRDGDLNRANDQLAQAENGANPDPDVIEALEAAVAAVEAEIATLQAQAATCQTDCQTELDDRVDSCTVTCKPCSTGTQFCIGGELLSFDGNPLFFPVDNVTGPTANSVPATIPEQYGYDFYPLESTIFPGAANHNFFFTSEVQYWFPYEADTQATLQFLGDDDVWVFLNGVLAVDLGGIHVPSEGTITINAGANQVTTTIQDGRIEAGLLTGINETRQGTPADYGLEPGNVYTITIFHAERQVDGSSFQLTLAGFEATPSDCSAICGDGVLSFGEECDDGVNDGGYNECGVGCVLGPFCGDGVMQADEGETCDIGPLGSVSCRSCREIRVQ